MRGKQQPASEVKQAKEWVGSGFVETRSLVNPNLEAMSHVCQAHSHPPIIIR